MRGGGTFSYTIGFLYWSREGGTFDRWTSVSDREPSLMITRYMTNSVCYRSRTWHNSQQLFLSCSYLFRFEDCSLKYTALWSKRRKPSGRSGWRAKGPKIQINSINQSYVVSSIYFISLLMYHNFFRVFVLDSSPAHKMLFLFGKIIHFPNKISSSLYSNFSPLLCLYADIGKQNSGQWCLYIPLHINPMHGKAVYCHPFTTKRRHFNNFIAHGVDEAKHDQPGDGSFSFVDPG